VSAASSRPQIALALAVESCCDTAIAASPANPSGRLRSGGRPARASASLKRASALISDASARSRAASVMMRDVIPRLEIRPSVRRLLTGMKHAAVLARARFFVGIEGVVERRQVLHQMLHLDFDPMNHVAAIEAIPVEGVERVRPRCFDDEANRTLRP